MNVILMMLVGALIGYITNVIAIRMLFRPYAEYRLLGRRVPFTPGLIHRRKEEMALKIGEIVKDDLLKEDRLKEVADGKLGQYLDEKQVSDKSLRTFVSTVGGNLADKFLAQIQLDEIVTEEIRQIDTVEIEKMVYKVSGTELRYIQYVGAFLGAVIGLVQYGIFALF